MFADQVLCTMMVVYEQNLEGLKEACSEGGVSWNSVLAQYANPKLVEKEKGTWERAVVAKHGDVWRDRDSDIWQKTNGIAS